MIMKMASPEVVQKPNSGYAPDTNSASSMPPTLAIEPASTKMPSFIRTMSTPRKWARSGLSRTSRSM